MKAKEFLKDLLNSSLFKGAAFMKPSCELKIISGELNPRSLYYSSFRKYMLKADPDVTLTIRGGDVQYLWKIE